MRTAVVLAGMLRETKLAHRFWSFLDEDIHVATWDVSLEGNNAKRAEPVFEPESLASLPYKTASACLLPYHGIDLFPEMRASFLWRYAEIELTAYEDRHGFVYDRVLLTRPDICFRDPIDLSMPLGHSELKAMSAVHRHAAGYDVLQDTCFLLRRHQFRRLAGFHVFRQSTHNPFDVHRALADYTVELGLRATTLPSTEFCIARKTSRDIEWNGNRLQMYERVKADSLAWWDYHINEMPGGV